MLFGTSKYRKSKIIIKLML